MTEKHVFHSSILREYDIRGVVDKTLTASDSLAIGRAFGTMVVEKGGKSVCVGYDGRLSSFAFEAEVVKGLKSCGLNVKCIGMGPTPMLYFASKDADAGIMITGSHNPPDQNGFKMVIGGKPFFGDDIRRLGEIALSGNYASGEGSKIEFHVENQYIERLLQDYSSKKELKVVWDAGNGATGDILTALTKRLSGKHTLLFAEVDGTFPNHHPDPADPENLDNLQSMVATEKADIGIAFDGDGDRIGVVDGNGRILWGDQLMILFAEEVLKTNPEATIIADVKASQVLFDEIKRMGGKPLMWRTGHSLIKSKMIETGSPLAGEMSGHIFFADHYYGYDDALYAAIRLLGIVANLDGETLSDRFDRIPHMINTPELRFECDDTRKFTVVEEVKQRLKKDGANVDDTDGVRVLTEDGWWLLRSSNTQAVLVARCEAKNYDALERIKSQLKEQLKLSKVELPS